MRVQAWPFVDKFEQGEKRVDASDCNESFWGPWTDSDAHDLLALEHSSMEQTASKRTASVGEVAYLRALVEAHGDDVESMARDRRRNSQQYTAGQLGRALARAGGFAGVRKQIQG